MRWVGVGELVDGCEELVETPCMLTRPEAREDCRKVDQGLQMRRQGHRRDRRATGCGRGARLGDRWGGVG